MQLQFMVHKRLRAVCAGENITSECAHSDASHSAPRVAPSLTLAYLSGLWGCLDHAQTSPTNSGACQLFSKGFRRRRVAHSWRENLNCWPKFWHTYENLATIQTDAKARSQRRKFG